MPRQFACASVEAHDRFLDLLTPTVCVAAVDPNASEPGFLQYAKRTDIVRGSSASRDDGSLGQEKSVEQRSQCPSTGSVNPIDTSS